MKTRTRFNLPALRATLSLGLLFLAGPALARRPPPPPPDAAIANPHGGGVIATLGVEGQSFHRDAALGLRLGLEGQRWGVDFRMLALALDRGPLEPTGDLQTLNMHLTYAFHTQERSRIRLHLGADALITPAANLMGPGFGVSMEACLLGPLDLEGRLQVTPFPFRQLEAQAGLALRMGPLALRGGLRTLTLDDAGQIDGLRRVESWVGPYGGLSLLF